MRSVLFVPLALLASQLAAQLEMGHRFGVAWSKWELRGADSELVTSWNDENEELAGFSFGIPLQYTIARRIRMSTGVQFMQRGYQWNSSQAYYHHYVQVPFALGANINVGALSIRPTAGGMFGYNAGGVFRYKEHNTADALNWPIGRDGEKGYSYTTPTNEWSALASLHLGYAFGRSSLEIGFGYLHGLTNVMYLTEFVNPTGEPVEAPQAFNRTLFLEFGYRIDLRRNPPPTIDTTATTIPVGHRKAVRVGQRFGRTLSRVAFDSDLVAENERINEGAAYLNALSTAVMVDIPLGKRSSLLVEAAYTQKGCRCQWYPRPTTGNDLLRMNYVELPLAYKRRFGSSRLRPFVLAGGVFSVGLGGLHRYDAVGGAYGEFTAANAVQFGDRFDRTKYYAFDASATAGAGFSVGSVNGEVTFDVRYQHGFVDFVTDDNSNLYSNVATGYHRTWLLNLGYLIPWNNSRPTSPTPAASP